MTRKRNNPPIRRVYNEVIAAKPRLNIENPICSNAVCLLVSLSPCLLVFSSCGRSSTAASAGLRVSEFSADTRG